ncbi:MAG: AP2 domain-containing protein [Pseudomonadota bacterium]
MRYIQRMDKGHHAWKVAIKRKTEYWHQYFTDSVYGSTGKALKAAKKWRDEKAADLTGVDYAVWKREWMRPNTSGIVGVYRCVLVRKRAKGIVEPTMWCGYWQNANGTRKSRAFSVAKYGEEGAKRLAVDVRKEGMEDVVRQLAAQRI